VNQTDAIVSAGGEQRAPVAGPSPAVIDGEVVDEPLLAAQLADDRPDRARPGGLRRGAGRAASSNASSAPVSAERGQQQRLVLAEEAAVGSGPRDRSPRVLAAGVRVPGVAQVRRLQVQAR
jgi:hypothetical protein